MGVHYLFHGCSRRSSKGAPATKEESTVHDERRPLTTTKHQQEAQSILQGVRGAAGGPRPRGHAGTERAPRPRRRVTMSTVLSSESGVVRRAARPRPLRAVIVPQRPHRYVGTTAAQCVAAALPSSLSAPPLGRTKTRTMKLWSVVQLCTTCRQSEASEAPQTASHAEPGVPFAEAGRVCLSSTSTSALTLSARPLWSAKHRWRRLGGDRPVSVQRGGGALAGVLGEARYFPHA